MFEVLAIIRPQPGLLEAHYFVGVAKMLDEGVFDVSPSTFAEAMPRMSCLAVRKEGSRENPGTAVVGQICQFLVQAVHHSRN